MPRTVVFVVSVGMMIVPGIVVSSLFVCSLLSPTWWVGLSSGSISCDELCLELSKLESSEDDEFGCCCRLGRFVGG